MNKKGFTLIELLGVIIILSTIVLLVIPDITGFVKSKKNDINSLNEDIVLSAVKLYVEDNKNDYPEIDGNVYCIDSSLWPTISEKYLSKQNNYDNSSIFKTVQVNYNLNNGYIVTFNSGCVTNYNNQ